MRPTLEEVKRLGLPAKVVLPSRVYGTNTSWMDTLYQRIPNLNDLFYAFADHPYWYCHDPAQGGPPVRSGGSKPCGTDERAGATTKPIFITEYGESTASCGDECVSEQAQAEHLQEMLEAVVTRDEWGVKMLSVFQLRDRGTGTAPTVSFSSACCAGRQPEAVLLDRPRRDAAIPRLALPGWTCVHRQRLWTKHPPERSDERSAIADLLLSPPASSRRRDPTRRGRR